MFIDMVSEKRTTWKLDMIHFWRVLRLMSYDPASTYQFMLKKEACIEEAEDEIAPDLEVARVCTCTRNTAYNDFFNFYQLYLLII